MEWLQSFTKEQIFFEVFLYSLQNFTQTGKYILTMQVHKKHSKFDTSLHIYSLSIVYFDPQFIAKNLDFV